MKNWLKSKSNQGYLLIIALLAVIYHSSFTSPFFQDDKTLLRLSKEISLFTAIPNYPYRPVSIQLFYSWGQQIFRNNVLGYHLVLFIFLAVGMYFAMKIAEQLLQSKKKALLATFFFALNVSLFANFYWIAVSYFSIGSFFVFGTIYFFLKSGRFNTILSILFFLFAVGCNEISFTLPIILLLLSWHKKSFQSTLLPYWILMPILFIGRLLMGGIPKNSDYSLIFNLQFFSTLRWYLFRALNLPEGVQRSNIQIYILFTIFIFLLLVSAFKYFKSTKRNFRLIIFCTLFFFISALPFFFLPKHMSSYYVTMALFGPAMVFAEIFNSKLIILGIITYIVLTVLGLDFLSHTHWIILKNTGPIGSFTNF